MNTLKSIRPHDKIELYNILIKDKDDIAALSVDFLQRDDDTIFIVQNHSKDIIGKVLLEEIKAEDSGYIFFQSELFVDPINNPMVPKHRIATEKEIKQYIHDNHIKLSSLPILKMTDPIRRWYNFKKGSVILIERKDEIYFRIVI